MTRFLLASAAIAGALALPGCPIPQPLAEVSRSADGGAVSTPTILPDSALPADTVVLVRTDCNPAAQFTLSASLEDVDTEESVEARWFRDYRADNTGLLSDDDVPAAADPSDPLRVIPPLVFRPYGFDASRTVGQLHVVEVVVSNRFLALSDPTQPFQRAAEAPFVTQSHRWVFQYVDPSAPGARCSFP